MAKKIKQTSEKQKQAFADFLRQRKPAHILRSISAAYDWASVEAENGFDPNLALHNALRRHSLQGYSINGQSITYSQARVVYEMVKLNRYGGLSGRGEQFPRPDGCFPEMVKQSSETYLKEYESALCSA